LLVKSTQDDKKIPYHDKVISGFKKLMHKIHPDFVSAKPILSGSAAISLVYAPKSYYGDLDIYFENVNDYQKAMAIINQMIPATDTNMHTVGNPLTEDEYEEGFVYWVTDNAVSVTLPNQKIQLIKKSYAPAEEMIYNHDFSNVSLAITEDTIYTTKETIFAWYEKKLGIRNYQLVKDIDIVDELGFYAAFLQRIEKYLSRYSLDLHENLYGKLLEVEKRTKAISSINSPEYAELTRKSTADRRCFVNYLYYGTQPSKVCLRTLLFEVCTKLQDLLTNHNNKSIFQENERINNENILF